MSILPKKKICVSCGALDYYFSRKMCKRCAMINKVERKEPKKIIEKTSTSNLVEDLDSVFSQYIRCKYADSNGMVECYTSGKLMKWQDAQCGHFISRKHYATRWLPQNCRPQSEYDNCFLSGNIHVYREKLEEENPGILEYLEEQSRIIYKPSIDELKEMIHEYRYKLSLIKTKFNK